MTSRMPDWHPSDDVAVGKGATLQMQTLNLANNPNAAALSAYQKFFDRLANKTSKKDDADEECEVVARDAANPTPCRVYPPTPPRWPPPTLRPTYASGDGPARGGAGRG